jgi:predicted nucleotidyltransferase
MNDQRFEALPYGSEGLWRKLMHAARQEASLEDIIAATKSKRYTRTRIDRMILCAFLGITEAMIQAPAPYARVLAFNDKGREILKKARQTGQFPNIGEAMDHPYQVLEDRCGSLYGLFALEESGRPDAESKYRVYY